ncbi:MAG: hypothetical protein ACYDG6_02160 [Thermincolia bacterium]
MPKRLQRQGFPVTLVTGFFLFNRTGFCMIPWIPGLVRLPK